MSSWPPTPLESTEKLEQLRALEHGRSIYVLTVDRATHGIDTAEQYAAAQRAWNREEQGRVVFARIVDVAAEREVLRGHAAF